MFVRTLVGLSLPQREPLVVLVMWDMRIVDGEYLDECMGDYSVARSSKNVEDGFAWAFAGI